MNRKAQIGPTSLEDLLPMTIAFLILFIFLTATFSVVGGHLEGRSVEAKNRAALEILQTLYGRSTLLYENNPGLLDESKLDSATPAQLSAYGLAAYSYSVEVEDLSSGERWSIGARDDNAVRLALPAAIRYSEDDVREGLLSVYVWRKK